MTQRAMSSVECQQAAWIVSLLGMSIEGMIGRSNESFVVSAVTTVSSIPDVTQLCAADLSVQGLSPGVPAKQAG